MNENCQFRSNSLAVYSAVHAVSAPFQCCALTGGSVTATEQDPASAALCSTNLGRLLMT